MTHDNTDIATLLTVVGGLLLLGLATDYLGRKSSLPRVSLLFLFGFLLGPGALGILPEDSRQWMPVVANIALLFVGFLLGGKLTRANTQKNGKVVIAVSISMVVVTLLLVTGGLLLLGTSLTVALLLSSIATATDPAATLDAIKENNAKGRFTDTLVGIVGIDDAWGLIAFSLVLAVVQVVHGTSEVHTILSSAAWELFGAVMLGIVLGIPMAFISGRIKPGQPTLLEATGMVLFCGGIAQFIGVSYLLASMVLGIVVVNVAKHHERPFHEIENVEWPFMVLFFALTGASLDLGNLSEVGILAIAYIVLRTLARYIGCWPGAWFAGSVKSVRLWMGGALLPQAGVATGMALIASAHYPELANTFIPVVVIATIFFEIIGPLCTKVSLRKAGDIN